MLRRLRKAFTWAGPYVSSSGRSCGDGQNYCSSGLTATSGNMGGTTGHWFALGYVEISHTKVTIAERRLGAGKSNTDGKKP